MSIFLSSSLCCFLFLNSCSTASLEKIQKTSSEQSVGWSLLQKQKKSSDQVQCYPSQPWSDLNNRSHQRFFSSLLPTMLYPTRSFLGIKNNFIGKEIVPPEDAFSLSKKRVFIEKTVFPTKEYSVRMYPLPQKENCDINAQKFSTHLIQLAPKAQGALDQDSSIQHLSKKHLKLDEVRALLDKII